MWVFRFERLRGTIASFNAAVNRAVDATSAEFTGRCEQRIIRLLGVAMRPVQKALTFDDVLLVPAHSRVLPRDVGLKTRLTRNIQLNIPLVSAAMDTVTESRLAIAIAQEGGVGIVHKNFPPKKQAAEVAKVKRYESGVLRDPVTVSPDITVRGLITVKDILKSSEHPEACKDQHGKLRVGAAVGVGEGTEERVAALVEAGVDVIVVDTAHGHSQGVLDRLKWIKRNAGAAEVIGGNIATSDGAKALVDHGANGVKVGIGPG